MPHQTLYHADSMYPLVSSQHFQLGVIAHHIEGIKEVKFSLNGGPITTVSSLSENIETSHIGYVVSIPATQTVDGEAFEVRARIVPNHGWERIIVYRGYDLAGETLAERYVDPVSGDNTNSGTSSSAPFEDIGEALNGLTSSNDDGAVIYIMGSSTTVPAVLGQDVTTTVENEWPIRITPYSTDTPFIEPDDYDFDVERVVFDGLEIQHNTTNYEFDWDTSSTSNSEDHFLFFRDIEFNRVSGLGAGIFEQFVYGDGNDRNENVFMVDSEINGLRGSGALPGFMRNVVLDDCWEFGINSDVRWIDVDFKDQRVLGFLGPKINPAFTDKAEGASIVEACTIEVTLSIDPFGDGTDALGFQSGGSYGAAIINNRLTGDDFRIFDAGILGTACRNLLFCQNSLEERVYIKEGLVSSDFQDGLFFGNICDGMWKLPFGGSDTRITMNDYAFWDVDDDYNHVYESAAVIQSWTWDTFADTYSNTTLLTVATTSDAYDRIDTVDQFFIYDQLGDERADPTAVGYRKGRNE